MAYRVKLPERLSDIHDVFNISHLQKCLHDTAEVVELSMLKEVEVEWEATIRRVPTRILGSEVMKLRNREVKLMKVQWEDNQKDATWETKDKIRASYPFSIRVYVLNFLSKAFVILVPII